MEEEQIERFPWEDLGNTYRVFCIGCGWWLRRILSWASVRLRVVEGNKDDGAGWAPGTATGVL